MKTIRCSARSEDIESFLHFLCKIIEKWLDVFRLQAEETVNNRLIASSSASYESFISGLADRQHKSPRWGRGMNRRRQHRHISPRAVRRYRAIKNFVRRALGSSSQQDQKSKSSISESVLDLRQKIDGFEQQLNTVSKHCQELVSLESRIKLNDNLVAEGNGDIDRKKSKVLESRVVYEKTSQDRCDKPFKDISSSKVCNDVSKTKASDLNKMINQNDSYNYKESRKNKIYSKLDSIEENEQALRGKRRNHMPSRNFNTHLTMYNSHPFKEPKMTHRLDVDYSEVQRDRNHKMIEYYNGLSKLNKDQELTCGDHKNNRNKYLRPSLDKDFIADVIRRQYRPVKLFGRRASDFSQFSAPVCKDQEFPIREMVQEESDLCSCYREENRRHRHSRYVCSNDLSDIRSICDTRLYSSKKHKHHPNYRKRTNGLYNDSTMYDIIPVKEKSSPKTDKKFVEDNVLMNVNYKEVPPSPRTQRPRLNLQAQLHIVDNDEDDGEIPSEKQLRRAKKLERRQLIQNDQSISNMSSDVFTYNGTFKAMENAQVSNRSKHYNDECIGTMSNLQYPMLVHEKAVIDNDTTLNTQTTDVSAVKTDKTLTEIKDILQNFLQEIKREQTQPQTEKFNIMTQSEVVGHNLNETQQQIKSNSFNNNDYFGQCSLSPFLQSFPNSCGCYPILPLCPINCMQNGFGLPSPNFTCDACANISKEGTPRSNDCKHKANNLDGATSDTQKIIKEIHNLISQNPNSIQKKGFNADNKLASNNKNQEPKTLASTSVGGSSKALKHDAKVGTTTLNCHSKSCEAIGSREATRNTTNFSYSDTILEKGSSEETETESATESEFSAESMEKQKENKFTKILRSMGIMKRNKSDDIEDLDKNDSYTGIVNQKEKPGFYSHPAPPFQQHIVNYNVHGQEYFRSPVTPQHQHHHECRVPAQYDPRICYSPRHHDMPTHRASPCHIPIPTSANCFDPQCLQVPPQVPVCLKEIEVKSIGTQSGKKMSLLRKLTNKMQGPEQQGSPKSPKPSPTRTPSKDKNSRNKPEPTLFDWKKFHEKAMQKNDPLKFSFNTQNKFAEGDNTMRDALIKKLFYKRNPFSPRNLLVRTILGKDKSSFGAPPKYIKPRMFM